MGATYTRQSSYSDGDVITAAHTNDEFNQLLAAFQASTGHTHDGTANEGGPITKMLGTSLTLGDGTAGTDITVTFDGETSDGVLKWMEDEDYFEFSDDILVASTEKLQFRDTAIYINSSTDGQLDLVADTEIQIAATTIDMNGNADVSGTLTYGSLSDGSITITAFVDEDDMSSNSATLVPTQQSVKAYVDTQLTAEDLDFQADSGGALSIDLDSETLTFTGGTGIDTSGSGNAVTFAIDSTVATLADTQTFTNKTLTSPKINENVALTATATELNLLDGVSGLVQADFTKLAAVDSTAAELNILDGDTSATSTTVADADRVVLNDNGTMVQVAVTDLAAYFDDEITAMPNLVTTAATTVGTLDSGAISSGFGNIDTGSSTITTTGLITGGSLDIDDVVINGTTIGHTDDTDLITLANGSVTIAGDLTVSGTQTVVDTVTMNAQNAIVFEGATADANETTLTIVDPTADRTINLPNQSGTIPVLAAVSTTQITSTPEELNILDGVTSTASELNILDGVTATTAELNYSDTGASVGTVVASKVVTVDANKDVSSFRNITLTGELDAGSLDVSGDADIDGTLEADAITVNGTALATVIADEATALAIALG